jgi:Leucine-rich repeat (LRR) protein
MERLRNVPNLTELRIYGCNISDKGFREVAHCRKLIRLHLKNLNITDAGVAHLAELTNLHVLEITGSPISDEALQHFAGLNELRRLELRNTQVHGTGLTGLRREEKQHLVDLVLSECPISAAGMKEIASIASLMFLNLSGSTVDDAGVAALPGSLRRLVGIDLSKTMVSDKAIVALSKFSNVQRIDLSGTKVNDAAIRQLRLPKSECVLRIANIHLSDDTIALLQSKYPQCRIDVEPDSKPGHFFFR